MALAHEAVSVCRNSNRSSVVLSGRGGGEGRGGGFRNEGGEGRGEGRGRGRGEGMFNRFGSSI